MFSRRLKNGYFVLEGLNSFATVYYFYYFYFFMQQKFGFGNKANLALAALNGAVYAIFSWLAGRLAQRHGYFTALKFGFITMMGALAVGLHLQAAPGQVVVMAVTVVGMCFTWPTLEALVSEGEPRSGVQHMVGIYNVVWAGTAALANFTGGAMLEKLGPRSLFCVPIVIQLCQLAITLWLEAQARRNAEVRPGGARGDLAGAALATAEGSPTTDPSRPTTAGRFLRMSWLANPFAYIAINTLIAVIPGVARRLELSTMVAGFCCSVWCFARVGAFFGLWFWNGWHYRFRWLLAAYLTLVGTFVCILLAPSLPVLVLSQMLFGGAIGLIYYSSLFYSMDLSETKSEHGGIHEAAIGLGNFAGPAVGAAALQFLPHSGNSGTLAVSGLLLLGLGGLAVIWRRTR
jgi:predicted MFS family arabinose efflux permease